MTTTRKKRSSRRKGSVSKRKYSVSKKKGACSLAKMGEIALGIAKSKEEEIDIDKNNEKEKKKEADKKKDSDKKRDNEKKGKNKDTVLDLETEIDQDLEKGVRNIDNNGKERGQDLEIERRLSFILKITLIKDQEIQILKSNSNKLLKKISPKRKIEQTFIMRMRANLSKTK